MKTFTNHQPGPRGINIKGGGTTWIESGQSVEIDPDTIEGDVPDLGKPSNHADQTDAANAELKAQVADLTAQLDAANAELKPHRIRAAVAGLDNKNEAHWTRGGEPAVDAVAAVVGSTVTRADINAAAPEAKRAA